MRKATCHNRDRSPIFVATQQFKLHRTIKKGLIMTKRNPISRMLTTFGSAVAVARAVESGRKPNARDLTNLGIEPVAFDNIRRF